MAQYSVLPHTGCPLAQLWWKSQERDSCELTILLQRRLCQAGRLQDVTGKATHGRDRSISWGQQEGSSSKLCWRFSTEGVAVPCGHSAHWPRCTGTHHAEPSCCPPLLNLCVLSGAPAMHLQEPTQVLITGDKVLTANNQHKAPVTHGSDASMSHPVPCGWASLVSCPGTGFAETLQSIQCTLAQYK